MRFNTQSIQRTSWAKALVAAIALTLFIAMLITGESLAEVLTWPAVAGAARYAALRNGNPNDGKWIILNSSVPCCSFDFPASYSSNDTFFGVEAYDANGKFLQTFAWVRQCKTCNPYVFLP